MPISRITGISVLICFLSFINQTASALPRLWGDVEYLNWWPQDSSVNIPLITQNNDPNSFAIIGQPGTQIIFGADAKDDEFNLRRLNGMRLTLGAWIDCANYFGIESSGFSFANQVDTISATSVPTNSPAINIPFFSTVSGTENVLVAAQPNTITDIDSFRVSGLELNGLYHWGNWGSVPVIFSAGFRYLNLYEKLSLHAAVFNIPLLPPGSTLNVEDVFSTNNKFYGFEVGARTYIIYCDFLFEALGQVAFGSINQSLNISGQTNVDNQTIIQPIGLFAEPSNIGTFTHNQFAILPELQIKLGYNENKYIHPFLTYDVMYLNHVLKPTESLDRNINTSQNALLGGTGSLSGSASPQPKFHATHFWLQGISLGMEFNWG